MYIYFIACTNNICIWFLLLYYKMTKTGKNSKKPNVFFCCCCCCCFLFVCLFVLPNANMTHIYCQHYQLTKDRNVCGAIFCIGAIHKVRTLKQVKFS